MHQDSAETYQCPQCKEINCDQAKILILTNELDIANKQLLEAKQYKDMYYKDNHEKHKEIEQVHILLDALPPCVPREKENSDGYGKTTLNLMTRLASYLAQRATTGS